VQARKGVGVFWVVVGVFWGGFWWVSRGLSATDRRRFIPAYCHCQDNQTQPAYGPWTHGPSIEHPPSSPTTQRSFSGFFSLLGMIPFRRVEY